MASILPGRRTAISLPSERPKGAGQPCLVIISGAEMGRRIDLTHEEVSIGRSDQCTVCVNSDMVSRRHAVINRILGRYIVVDLKSTNGTFVNDQRIERAELKDGDLLRTGKTVLKYLENNLELEYMRHILSLAAVDSLTGLYNKRHFDEVFGKEAARADQSQQPLCLILLDIDHFKKINDNFGHPAGDAVLKHVASVVKAQIRASDTLCRVGGEEFALILPQTPLVLATQAAELIRVAVDDTACDVEGTIIPATSSLGVAQLGPGEAPEGLYRRSDERLYAAKHSGRNRVC
ncbi:MAG: GGDEF domain-containing protein [Pseudomonadota bacterium]